MGLTNLPTKTDGSIGRVKSTLPGSDPSPDLDYYVVAAEHEAIKTALVDVCAEVGLSDGSTAGSLVERVTTLEGAGGGGWSHVSLMASAALADANAIVEVDLDAGAAATLTLPAPSAGRVYLIRKISGSSAKTITLAPHTGTVEIDGVAGSYTLPGSAVLVDAAARRWPYASWIVWTDGAGWLTSPLGPQARHVWAQTSAPVDATHGLSSEFFPGATWHETSGGNPGKLWINAGTTLGQGRWHRVDAIDPVSVSADATLPSKDALVYVDATGGVVELTLPSPGGSNAGRQFAITKVDAAANKITLIRAGSELINNVSANFDLPGSDGEAIGRWHVSSDGTNWWVF